MRCGTCGGSLVELPTKVGDEELTMLSCSHCDTRVWRRGDEVIDLRQVLDLTADAHPKGRRPATGDASAEQTAESPS